MTTPKTQMLVGDRYEIEESLGKGGFGVVCRARDTLLNRTVALKLLRLPTDGGNGSIQTIRERFLHEATAAGRISHPNVVAIYDVGVPANVHESTAFIVMEYLDGENLYQRLKKHGPYEPERALAQFVPLVFGIGKGHELGVVHKDIKPGNIFVRDPATPNESFCLLDFGIARLLHERKMTTTGLLVGTPHYMAPEYISKNLVTPALDVYQLGLILVELLTGKPAVPHSETYLQCCNRHFAGKLDIPIALLDGPFGEVLKKCLATQPERRFQDATALGTALAEVAPESIADDFRKTDALSAIFKNDWVNPFNEHASRAIPTLDGVPELWTPADEDEASADDFDLTDVSFEGPPITGSELAPTTNELRGGTFSGNTFSGNTFSGNTQKGIIDPESEIRVKPPAQLDAASGSGPITSVHRTQSGQKLIIATLVLVLVIAIGAVGLALLLS